MNSSYGRTVALLCAICFFWVGGAATLNAQQSEADRKLLAEIRAQAENGDAQSQSDLGRAFDFGNLGASKDHVEAVKWYRKAAEQNDARAQNDLGFCCANGQGVAQDYVEAVKWWGKAAEQNDALAQRNLAISYDDGLGVTKDHVEAVKWYRKAAEQNLAVAQVNLGFCYANGQGVAQDYVEAVKWWGKAAEQDNAQALFNLGVSYAKGEGVAKNEMEAVKWWRKAAEQNQVGAQYILGLCFAKGNGVAKDYVESYKWWYLAAAQGDENARKGMTILEKQMSPEQTAEGQKLVRNYQLQGSPSAEGNGSNIGIMQTRLASSGTGFFITDDGYLITNNHVVEGANQVRLITSAGMISAKVVRVDAANDLALLRADGKFSPLPVAASRGVKLGGTVATVGFPNPGMQGFAPKLAKGEIASLSGAGDDSRYFQISAPVQPGNSGGALVDEHGNVVGVVSAKLNASVALAASGALPENVNYAVKSSFLLSFLESVPDVSAKLKEPSTADRKFEDVVKSAQDAAVLVLVY